MTEKQSTAGNNILSSGEGDAVLSHAQVLYDRSDRVPGIDASAAALAGFGTMAGKPLTSQEIASYHRHISHIGDLLAKHDWDEKKHTIDEDAKMRTEIRRVLGALSRILPKEEAE